AEHMDAPDRCSSLHKSSCTAGAVHTWLNDHIIAQLRWCRGRPTHHVNTSHGREGEHGEWRPDPAQRSATAVMAHPSHIPGIRSSRHAYIIAGFG
ncbi:hypothetical protein ACH0BU_17700, partial [Sphingomonas olei]